MKKTKSERLSNWLNDDEMVVPQHRTTILTVSLELYINGVWILAVLICSTHFERHLITISSVDEEMRIVVISLSTPQGQPWRM